jgi:DNA polymerase-3 subunit alpha (Gram-positive type)
MMSKVHELTYVVFDLEATYHPLIGLHEIIEIGAHKLEPTTLAISTSFETLVRPSSPISRQIKQKTGITDELVREAKPINDLWDAFTSFVEKAILVAHQASFDMSVLKKTAEYYKLQPLTNSVVDTLRLAKRLYPKEASYGLRHFRAKFELSDMNEHRATDDAYITAFLFKHLVQILENEYGITEYSQLQDFCYGANPGQMKLF